MLGKAFEGGIDLLVRWVILPVTGVIPVLVRTGLLFLGFAALWFAFFAALGLDPAVLASTWTAIGELPLPVAMLAWVLFLPLVAALWAWSTDWPVVVRLVLVVGIAAWNLVIFLPRRETRATAATPATPAPSGAGREA